MAEENPKPMGFNFVDLDAPSPIASQPPTESKSNLHDPSNDASDAAVIAIDPLSKLDDLSDEKDNKITDDGDRSESLSLNDQLTELEAELDLNQEEDNPPPPLPPFSPLSGLKSVPQEEPIPLGQVNLKPEKDKMLMIFPPIAAVGDWTDLWEDITHRLRGMDYNWSAGTPVHLHCREHLLGSRELQEISELLKEVDLSLVKVFTTRRQTAVAAVTAGYSVDQQTPGDQTVLLGDGATQEGNTSLVKEPLYYANTVRSGVELNHPGSVIVVGDVNPGGIITAGGDILVWGMLRGIAHAGAEGDRRRKIMALQLKAPQVRIADAVALVPEQKLPTQDYPEIAYITTEGIRITQASKFSKQFQFSDQANGWVDSSIDNFNEA